MGIRYTKTAVMTKNLQTTNAGRRLNNIHKTKAGHKAFWKS